MSKNLIFLTALFFIVMFSSCSENQNNSVKHGDIEINSIELMESSDEYRNRDLDLGILPEPAELSKTMDTINQDDYEIIFTDYYGDPFYLNLKTSENDFKFYRGVWSTGGHVYDCTIMYNISTKALSLNGYYRDSKVMMYHLVWTAEDYFTGRYTWLYAGTKEYNNLYKMNIRISKGSFTE